MPSEQPNGASSSRRRRHRDGSRRRRGAFTLTELIVVMVIIIILMAILIPMASHVRQSARAAATQQLIMTLTAAIEQYRNDWGAYPGPLGWDQVGPGVATITTELSPGVTGFATTAADNVTMSENLVLGLMGGMRLNAGGDAIYDPSLVGQGPQTLNSTAKRQSPYLTNVPLSWRGDGVSGPRTGRYEDDSAAAVDSIIPEILDEFGDRLPILYLRARVGVSPTGGTMNDNRVVTIRDPAVPGSDLHNGPYDVRQIIGYTGTKIGVGKAQDITRLPDGAPQANPGTHGLQTVTPGAPLDPTSNYPYDAYPYFLSRTIPNTPRNKDGFILISAGKDRIYGTDDDICNFGAVRE